MWHEYPIPADYNQQKEIIRELRMWIEELEKREIITGFAFNHYYNNPLAPNELRIRFEYSLEENSKAVEKELASKVKQFLSSYVLKHRIWNSGKTPEHILRAYEYGSRCAFLFWELAQKERFAVDLTSNFYPISSNQSSKTFNFQLSFNHGIMNSLGINKTLEELLVHLFHVIASTKSSNVEELCKWLKNNKNLYEIIFKGI